MELAGPVSSPAPPPPPVNARTLLTHAAGSGPAHWSADGYLSAVARTGPDVVWPLEEGGPPASCIGTGAQRFVATDAAVADVGARQAPDGWNSRPIARRQAKPDHEGWLRAPGGAKHRPPRPCSRMRRTAQCRFADGL